MPSTKPKTKKNVFFLVFVAILPIVTLFSSLINSQPANALWGDDVQSNTKGTEVFDRISSVAYYNAISECMNKGWDLGISAPQLSINTLKTGEWFLIDDAVPIGVYMRDSAISNSASSDINNAIKSNDWDGKVQCNNKQLIKGALQLWGLAGKEIEVLCNSGWKNKAGEVDGEGNNFEQTPEECIKLSSTDQGENILWFTGGNKTHTRGASVFQEYIKRTIFGNNLSTDFNGLKAIDKYVFYRHSLSQSCLKGLDSTAPQTTAQVDSSIGYNGLKWIDFTSGQLITGSMLVSKDWGRIGRPLNLAPLVANSTCPKTVDAMNSLADEVMAVIQAAQKTGEKIEVKQDTTGTQTDNTTTKCAISGVGWIFCPIINFMTDITDGAYKQVVNLLTTKAINTSTDSGNTLYQAWGAMRTIANVIFVIFFLVIIFSQLTNVGITNYGIKKSLPKLIIAAILVNLSYFICAIAVDITNIVGVSLEGFFNGIGAQFRGASYGAFSGEGGWAVIGGGILAGAVGWASVAAGLSIFLPALIAALLAVVTVFLTLVIRQALIIILIVISPLAFVAFLLPNTERLFKKWLDMFTSLLVMFPLIALVFSASSIASKVITGGSTGDVLMQVVGALASVIPLFLIPTLMKTGGSALSKIGGVIGGLAKKPADSANKWAGGVREREQARLNNKAINSGGRFNVRANMLKRNARLAAIKQSQESEAKRATSKYLAEEIQSKDGKLLSKMSAGGSAGVADRSRANAISVLEKMNIEEVSAQTALIKNLDQTALRTLSQGGSYKDFNASNNIALRQAAMKMTVDAQDIVGINQLLDQSSDSTKMDKETRQVFADVLSASSGRPSYIGQGAIAGLRQSAGMNSTDSIIKAINDNVYSPDKIANASKDESSMLLAVARGDTKIQLGNDLVDIPAKSINIRESTPEKAGALETLSANAKAAQKEPLYSGKIAKQIDQVQGLSSLGTSQGFTNGDGI